MEFTVDCTGVCVFTCDVSSTSCDVENTPGTEIAWGGECTMTAIPRQGNCRVDHIKYSQQVFNGVPVPFTEFGNNVEITGIAHNYVGEAFCLCDNYIRVDSTCTFTEGGTYLFRGEDDETGLPMYQFDSSNRGKKFQLQFVSED